MNHIHDALAQHVVDVLMQRGILQLCVVDLLFKDNNIFLIMPGKVGYHDSASDSLLPPQLLNIPIKGKSSIVQISSSNSKLTKRAETRKNAA